MSENLWGITIDKPEFNNPKKIIEEQASFLSRITKDKVLAKVNEINLDVLNYSDWDHFPFKYEFKILGTFLDTYQFKVFIIAFDIPYYPLNIYIDTDIRRELGLTKNINAFQDAIRINNEQELKDYLKAILSSDKINVVVSTLVNMQK